MRHGSSVGTGSLQICWLQSWHRAHHSLNLASSIGMQVLWLLGYREQLGERNSSRKLSFQLHIFRLLWKHKCYSQTEACCTRLAMLESKGIQMQGHQCDPHNKRVCSSRSLLFLGRDTALHPSTGSDADSLGKARFLDSPTEPKHSLASNAERKSPTSSRAHCLPHVVGTQSILLPDEQTVAPHIPEGFWGPPLASSTRAAVGTLPGAPQYPQYLHFPTAPSTALPAELPFEWSSPWELRAAKPRPLSSHWPRPSTDLNIAL